MNTRQLHSEIKKRGSADVTYLGHAVDEMIWNFMEENSIPGLTLAIVQAPYIPRVVGYGMSDKGQRRLASANTMWPAGPISQAYAAVAVMQLYESGKLDLYAGIGSYIPFLPKKWSDIPVITLLRHASGIPDYRSAKDWHYDKPGTFSELLALVSGEELLFAPGTEVRQSATNFLLLTEAVEQVSGMSYHDFVHQNQIDFLNLKRTGFAEDLKDLNAEDLSLTDNIHQLFKADRHYIDPTEPAQSYDENGLPIPRAASSALRGFSDIWASAQDISYWDIALAGSVLIHDVKNRALIYAAWKLPSGENVPAAAGWQFYHHRGLMDIKGSIPGYSSFLSRFTDPAELVCVTLLANKGGIDFTNLARRIAGAFGDFQSTGYDDNRLYLRESQFPAEQTVGRLKKELERKGIPLFAEFDHAKNAAEAGLSLRPTTVLVFGSPKVGTGLMQLDQSISLELPLRISVWEDQNGSTWLAFKKPEQLTEEYETAGNEIPEKMQALLEALVQHAGSLY